MYNFHRNPRNYFEKLPLTANNLDEIIYNVHDFLRSPTELPYIYSGLQNKYSVRDAFHINCEVSTNPVGIYDHNINGLLVQDDKPTDQFLIIDSTKDFNVTADGTDFYEPQPGTSNCSSATKSSGTSPNNSVLDLLFKEPNDPDSSSKKLNKCYLYCCRYCNLKFPTIWELNRHKVKCKRFFKPRGTPNANVTVDMTFEELMKGYKTMP